MTPRDRVKADKLRAALDAAELWRAKEILSGRIGSGRYDPATYEQLGQVLLEMGDHLAAGRFLFLSGVRRPEYASAIELYLRRHSRGGWRSLLAAFPASARRATWSELPATVREDLRALGVPPRPDDETVWATHQRQVVGQSGWLGALGCALILIVIGLLVSIVGVYLIDSGWIGPN